MISLNKEKSSFSPFPENQYNISGPLAGPFMNASLGSDFPLRTNSVTEEDRRPALESITLGTAISIGLKVNVFDWSGPIFSFYSDACVQKKTAMGLHLVYLGHFR